MANTTEQPPTLKFIKACEICKTSAREDGRLYFIRRRSGDFVMSLDGSKGWLYSAYPGGRAILSLEGKELIGV